MSPRCDAHHLTHCSTCTPLPAWEQRLLRGQENKASDEALAALREKLSPTVKNVPIPTTTMGKITAEFMHDPESDYPGAAAPADMVRIETPQGYVEVTVCNGATHVMISEARLGETKAEFLLGTNGTFQKIG